MIEEKLCRHEGRHTMLRLTDLTFVPSGTYRYLREDHTQGKLHNHDKLEISLFYAAALSHDLIKAGAYAILVSYFLDLPFLNL